ncbi:hypothetical protein [Serinibacter salmoneus]|uniref:hypothetical protein n=1 Tax=Serinibacter salmoneus TaxID=556530 RepID=UPI000BF5B052|nr:hypothetical protein [Serinibacter salmoneus]
MSAPTPLPAPLPIERALAHHVLAVDHEVADDELETLLLSLVLDAQWDPAPAPGAPGTMDLLPLPAVDATHELPAPGERERAAVVGPWSLNGEARRRLALPDWANTAYLVEVATDRSPLPAPPLPLGYGALLDAFGPHHPRGVEKQVLDVAHACARRLGGALRTTTGVVIVPDPGSAVDHAVHAPVWLEPVALRHVLAPALPGLQVHVDDPQGPVRSEDGTYQAGADLGGGDRVLVEVFAAERLRPALRFAPWAADGVITYAMHYLPAQQHREARTRAETRRRDAARQAIEGAVLVLHEAVGGEILDEDGFFVEPQQLRGDIL